MLVKMHEPRVEKTVATLQIPAPAATPAGAQSDFELPEWVVNDVLEAGIKKKRKVA